MSAFHLYTKPEIAAYLYVIITTSRCIIQTAENADGKLCFDSPTEAFGNGSEVRQRNPVFCVGLYTIIVTLPLQEWQPGTFNCVI